MGLVEDVRSLSASQIEDVEKLTLRWIYQAALEFGPEAIDIFLNSPDEVRDVAEDITRELLDRLSGYNIQQRIYGNVDYKRARYIILPEQLVRQALFVDSKAEKNNQSATIQMSQTSMRVRQVRSERSVDEKGHLPESSVYDGNQYLTTTAVLHFGYKEINEVRHLFELTIVCLPNGLLQDLYNPTVHDSFWIAGRNAPTRGEDFRVRLSFQRLKAKASWRVQKIRYTSSNRSVQGTWDD